MVGQEDLEDMASAADAALSFVAGHTVDEVVRLGEEIFDERIADKLYAGTIAMARTHLDAGQRVWLVSAAPVELATIIARRLGLTGALGTVSEIVDGEYTGRLVGSTLHGPAKAEAVRALAEREDLDLSRCAAYSDSANDIPMLTLVGHPVAVNPDPACAATPGRWAGRSTTTGPAARRPVGVPTALAIGVAAGIGAGVVRRRHAPTSRLSPRTCFPSARVRRRRCDAA